MTAAEMAWSLPPHAADVLALFGFPHGNDTHDDLFWRTLDDGTIELFADCSDCFAWATADAEPIEPDDLDLLRQCYLDLRSVDETLWLAELFAARKRHRRPMQTWMDRHAGKAIDLFNACPAEVSR